MKVRWNETAGYTFIILASCFWGGSASLGKTLMQSGISTVMLMQVRSVLTAVALLPFLLVFGRRHLKVEKADILLLVLLGIPGLALVNVSYYYAIKQLPIAVVVFIQFTAPVIVFVYGFFSKKEHASWPKLLALTLSLSGTYFMVQLQGGAIRSAPAVGIASAFVSMMSFALYLVLSHHLGKKYSPWTIIIYGYGIASIFWCILQNVPNTIDALNQNHLWKNAAMFSVCSTLIPFVLFLNGLRKVTATGGAIASTSETVTASVFAYIFLGESLSIVQVAGAALILAAILILIYRSPESGVENPESRVETVFP